MRRPATTLRHQNRRQGHARLGLAVLYVDDPTTSAAFNADIPGRSPAEASPTFDVGPALRLGLPAIGDRDLGTMAVAMAAVPWTRPRHGRLYPGVSEGGPRDTPRRPAR